MERFSRMHFRILARTCAIAVLLAPFAWGDALAEAGRAIFEKHKDAVVTVELVINQKFTMSGGSSQDDESKTEANGTVINAEGLTVVSLSETDPSAIMEAMMAGSGRMNGFQVDTEIRDAKILRGDGDPIPAEVILRDKELDMAFLRPIEKVSEPFQFIDFSDSDAPKLLDQVISISRLSKVARRVHAASIERIDAIVEKPRTFFIPGRDPTNTNLGSPAFTVDGKPIGVFLIRVIKDTSGGRGGFGGFNQNLTTVLLPASDILEAAAQAPPYED